MLNIFPAPKAGGFTLLELLIALTILSIIAGISFANFNQLERYHVQSAARSLAQSIQSARISAVQRGSSIYLCLSRDGLQCERSAANRILIYDDLNGDKLYNAGDSLMAERSFPAQIIQINWRAFQNKRYLELLPSGMTHYQNGTFTVCGSSNAIAVAEAVIVNMAGRPYFAKDKNKDGVKEYSNGQNLSCS